MGDYINEILELARTKLGDTDVGIAKVDKTYSDAYDTAMRKELYKALKSVYM